LQRAKDRLENRIRVPQPAQRLVVKTPGQLLFLNATDIDWIEAAGYYACVHVGNSTHILRRTLQDLERDLGEEKFVRIHRSNHRQPPSGWLRWSCRRRASTRSLLEIPRPACA
jgi:two-component system LytT family response regulator